MPTSYRRETALQLGLVMAKSGRLELGDRFTDIIGLSSTTVTYVASKAIEFGGKKTQNKGYYAVQGRHPCSAVIIAIYIMLYTKLQRRCIMQLITFQQLSSFGWNSILLNVKGF